MILKKGGLQCNPYLLKDDAYNAIATAKATPILALLASRDKLTATRTSHTTDGKQGCFYPDDTLRCFKADCNSIASQALLATILLDKTWPSIGIYLIEQIFLSWWPCACTTQTCLRLYCKNMTVVWKKTSGQEHAHFICRVHCSCNGAEWHTCENCNGLRYIWHQILSKLLHQDRPWCLTCVDRWGSRTSYGLAIKETIEAAYGILTS